MTPDAPQTRESGARTFGPDEPHYFVMVVGQPKRNGTRVIAVHAFNARDAHQFAAKEYRAAEGLASSVFVQTERVHEVATEDAARAYLDRLAKVMAEHVAARQIGGSGS